MLFGYDPNEKWFLFLTYGEWKLSILSSIVYFLTNIFIFKNKFNKSFNNTLLFLIGMLIILNVSNLFANYQSKLSQK